MSYFRNIEEIIKNYAVKDRFLRYVEVDTQSNEESDAYPSTPGQWDLLRMLKSELEALELEEIKLDDNGYLTATLPANLPSDWPKGKEIPTIAFIAHVDTSPDSSGKDVTPIVHNNYQGGEIRLPHNDIVLNYENSPMLKECIGFDIITADGSTLLGADDKAGVAEIMDAMRILKTNPEIYHGKIKVALTPDEEIGKGVAHFDLDAFGADFAYTMDGGTLGEIENETFNADTFVATFMGISYHPGYAKDKLVNSIKMATDFVEMFPKTSMSPETTENKEGYIHPIDIKGGAETTEVKVLVRDFELEEMKKKEKTLEKYCEEIRKKYPKGKVETKVLEYYRNMRFKLEEDLRVVKYAIETAERMGIEVKMKPIRGGTDGAVLSYKGLLTPNIFAGGQNFHGKYEWVPVQWMERATAMICNLTQIWLEKSA